MKTSKGLTFSGQKYQGNIDEPTICPRCHHAIKAVELHCEAFSDEESRRYCAVLYLCKHCYEVFTVLYACKTHSNRGPYSTSYHYDSELLYIGPSKYKGSVFKSEICELSPDFVRIYNQAEQAESLGMEDIAGMGYRKALEFLVKDFCIHLKPEDENKIKTATLSKCINDRIDNQNIKTLALRSAWLGNDEAHYLRKHEDRDVKDLKKFIDACVYFVGMTLVIEDASSIPPA